MKGLIFTYGVTYGGAAVALFNPFYGLLAYVCFAIIKPESLWFWSVQPGNYSRIIAIAMLIGWAAKGFGDWRLGKAKWVILPLLGFWGCGVVGAIFADNQKVAWDFVESLTKIVLPVLVGITTIREERQLRILAWVMVASTGYLGYNENLKYFQYGNVAWDNMTAHAMAVGAVLAFFLGTATKNIWGKWTAFVFSGLMAHAVLFHMSRGAMLGLCTAAIFTIALIPKTPRGIGLFLLAVLVGWQLAGESVLREFETIFAEKEERDKSAQSRFDLWADMWNEAKQNPVLGIGPRHWPLVAARYGWPAGKEGHGLWIQMMAETGIPGGVLYFLFFVSGAALLWRPARSKTSGSGLIDASFARMTVVGLLTFITESMFGSFSLVELPYYMAMVGAVTLRLSTATVPLSERELAQRPQIAHNPDRLLAFQQASFQK